MILENERFREAMIGRTAPDFALTLSIKEKRVWFHYNMKKLESRNTFLEPFTLVIAREWILEDTFNQLKTIDDLNLRGYVRIYFIDEEALDAGGVIKEWINILIDKIFSQDLGLFVPKTESETFYTINPTADLEKIHFAG